MKRILILGGTGDASRLAAELAQQPNLTVITSLAGRTQSSLFTNAFMGQTRIGGFGGVQGLADYLQTQKIDGLIDATHPFAAQMSWSAAAAARKVEVPRLMFVRPAWQKTPADRWIEVESLTAAAAVLPGLARRVFLTIGRQDLAIFADLPDIWFLMRMIEPPATAPAGVLLLERGPFTEAAERALLVQYEIGAIVSKNSGGAATEAKLKAAQALEIPVVMVQRPPLPDGERAATLEEALRWMRRNKLGW